MCPNNRAGTGLLPRSGRVMCGQHLIDVLLVGEEHDGPHYTGWRPKIRGR